VCDIEDVPWNWNATVVRDGDDRKSYSILVSGRGNRQLLDKMMTIKNKCSFNLTKHNLTVPTSFCETVSHLRAPPTPIQYTRFMSARGLYCTYIGYFGCELELGTSRGQIVQLLYDIQSNDVPRSVLFSYSSISENEPQAGRERKGGDAGRTGQPGGMCMRSYNKKTVNLLQVWYH
jgi:hypothetical protein